MKKISLLFSSMVCFGFALQAQKVGINVTAPSENLHVDSTIKIGKNNAISSSTPGRKNLLKFGDASYVTIGEEQADDKLYIRYGDLIFFPSNGAGANGTGRIGIGTESPTADLHLSGTLRLEGNGAGAGKVLTSDATGNATWQTPSSSAAVGFRGRLYDNWAVAVSTDFNVKGLTEIFNDGSGFNAFNGTFTAPSNGVYSFTANINWLAPPAGAGTILYTLRLRLTRAGSTSTIDQVNTPVAFFANYGVSTKINSIYKLNAGDIVFVEASHSHSATLYISGNGGSFDTNFSGAKLY